VESSIFDMDEEDAHDPILPFRNEEDVERAVTSDELILELKRYSNCLISFIYLICR